MDNDDRQVGRILTRREVLVMLAGMGGAALLAACDPMGRGEALPTSTPASPSGSRSTGATPVPRNAEAATAVAASPVTASPTAGAAAMPGCVVRPELTEGPYFVDEKLNRSDIRSDPSDGSIKEGAPLKLAFRVMQVGAGCVPLAGAMVDIWHCDAHGLYSDVTDRSFSTVGKKFLRGYQVTGENGLAQFTTIYPGWYQGRAVHIHFKIRTGASSGQSYEFTSQLFFDDALSDEVYTQEPYASKGSSTLKNAGDGIYRQSGGQLTLDATKDGQGYAATFDIGLQV
jgi:protocatechuate 3,4-dioxygenase beta subunit